MKIWTWPAAVLLIAVGVMASAEASAEERAKSAPLVIQAQGSFAVGGTVVTNPGTFDPAMPTPAGQTLHGDHAYAFYQIPVNSRKYPLVLWHGAGQFSKTWETTPDGREGYQSIFPCRGVGVYVLDQPRRGNAGRKHAAGHDRAHTPMNGRGSTSFVWASGRITFPVFSFPATRKA
ncbi:hypothetical protein [Azospirillum sp. B506]|uniref:hypothetical protein n=1 Tax=Azospirillum sp. B506 TaxID=137721 RepID=UPI0003476C4F|nr:hypothetical protein [Azospirillum sp. B506]